MDVWLATLDALLARPFPNPPAAPVHHVDLAVSESFWDDETRDAEVEKAWDRFEADRKRLAEAVSGRYGPPERKNLEPYFLSDWNGEPGGALFRHLTMWRLDVDLWRVGDRGVVVEIGQQDKELPLQLMIVVGDLTDAEQG